MNSWQLQLARHHLLHGAVIAYPTEAVWGLGCLPDDRSAVLKLCQLKQRSISKGLILVAASLEQLQKYLAPMNPTDIKRIQDCWPGPVTWLIPHGGHAPPWICGSHQTVAVRVTDHPGVRRLCNVMNSPIVSTSANRASQAPARSILQVRRAFRKSIDYILPGELGDRDNPTEIRDLVLDKIVRTS